MKRAVIFKAAAALLLILLLVYAWYRWDIAAFFAPARIEAILENLGPFAPADLHGRHGCNRRHHSRPGAASLRSCRRALRLRHGHRLRRRRFPGRSGHRLSPCPVSGKGFCRNARGQAGRHLLRVLRGAADQDHLLFAAPAADFLRCGELRSGAHPDVPEEFFPCHASRLVAHDLHLPLLRVPHRGQLDDGPPPGTHDRCDSVCSAVLCRSLGSQEIPAPACHAQQRRLLRAPDNDKKDQ